MTVPAALLSHASNEHYTPQYILEAVIACMEAIDLDPCSNSREIPNVPAARHYTAQDNGPEKKREPEKRGWESSEKPKQVQSASAKMDVGHELPPKH